jgi:hypothetical protein
MATQKKHPHHKTISDKLYFQKLGKFKVIIKIEFNTYKLDLPLSMKVHSIFHVSLFEPASQDPIEGHHQPPALPVIVTSQEKYKVQIIMDLRHWHHYRKLQY